MRRRAPRRTRSNALVEDLLADPAHDWQEQLRMLDETSMLRNCWEDAGRMRRAEDLYAQLGARATVAGHGAAMTAALDAQESAPLWTRLDPLQGLEDIDRRRMLELIYGRHWPQTLTLARRLRLVRRLDNDQKAIVEWAIGLAPRTARLAARPAR